MKKAILIIAAISIHVFGSAQDANRTSAAMDDDGNGGFGGPLIRVTQVMDDWGVMIGGKGGAIINNHFAFGGVGMALVGGNNFTGENLNGNAEAPLNLGLAGGGVFVQYIHKSDNLIQFSVPLHVMAGGVSVTENEQEVESTGIFMLEPGVNLEFNLSDTFIPALTVSYRQVFGTSLKNVSDQDVSGLNLGLIFKFGAF